MAANSNSTTIVTVGAGGALLMKTMYRVQHTRQLGNARNEIVSRDRSLGRDASGGILNLNTKYVFRGKVAHVTETLTRAGPPIKPAKFAEQVIHGLVQKLRARKIILGRPAVARLQASASGATAAAPAQAIARNDGPAQRTRSAAASASAVADAVGDLEMTGASAGEAASLTGETLQRIINALAQVAPGARLQLAAAGEAGNVTANGRWPPRTVDVLVPNGAGTVPITREFAQWIANAVHQVAPAAPAVRVRFPQPPRALQSATQPPPPRYTAADEARARLLARRGWVRT